MNQRTVYGESLVALGKKDNRVVACEADLGGSTMSVLFQKEFPARYFEMGIAEQNMASFAAGLSRVGKIPFIHSFAMFVTGRCYEQIRQSICIGGFPVRVIGSSYGLSDFGDGATHQAIEDISLMKTLPNMTVLAPVDGAEVQRMMEVIPKIDGPVYMRLNRNDLPEIPAVTSFTLGKPFVVREGSDAVVFAHGIMVSRSLEAAAALEKEGVSLRVVNVSTLKPVDGEALLSLSRGMKAVLTAEEHSIYGGLGSVVEHHLRGVGIPMTVIGIEDKFGRSAHTYEELLEAFGLTAQRVSTEVKKLLAVKTRA